MDYHVSNRGLCLFCFGLILLTGCLPDDSLDFSADGSVGLLRTSGRLYVVDGDTGALSPVPASKVSPWPDISADGKRIAYAHEVKHATLAEGLKTLPPSQVEMIADDAKSLREKVLGGTISIGDFNSISDEGLGYVQPYRGWVVRSLCEDADEQLTQKLGAKAMQQGRTAELLSTRLVVAALADSAIALLMAERVEKKDMNVTVTNLAKRISSLRQHKRARSLCTSHLTCLSVSIGDRIAKSWHISSRWVRIRCSARFVSRRSAIQMATCWKKRLNIPRRCWPLTAVRARARNLPGHYSNH